MADTNPEKNKGNSPEISLEQRMKDVAAARARAKKDLDDIKIPNLDDERKELEPMLRELQEGQEKIDALLGEISLINASRLVITPQKWEEFCNDTIRQKKRFDALEADAAAHPEDANMQAYVAKGREFRAMYAAHRDALPDARPDKATPEQLQAIAFLYGATRQTEALMDAFDEEVGNYDTYAKQFETEAKNYVENKPEKTATIERFNRQYERYADFNLKFPDIVAKTKDPTELTLLQAIKNKCMQADAVYSKQWELDEKTGKPVMKASEKNVALAMVAVAKLEDALNAFDVYEVAVKAMPELASADELPVFFPAEKKPEVAATNPPNTDAAKPGVQVASAAPTVDALPPQVDSATVPTQVQPRDMTPNTVPNVPPVVAKTESKPEAKPEAVPPTKTESRPDAVPPAMAEPPPQVVSIPPAAVQTAPAQLGELNVPATITAKTMENPAIATVETPPTPIEVTTLDEGVIKVGTQKTIFIAYYLPNGDRQYDYMKLPSTGIRSWDIPGVCSALRTDEGWMLRSDAEAGGDLLVNADGTEHWVPLAKADKTKPAPADEVDPRLALLNEIVNGVGNG